MFSSDVLDMDVCSSDYVVKVQLKEVIFREKGQVRAFSGLCPQYKAPLKNGALDEGIIICA
jgi:nitrite reductase/ring-hydroxylating ferredoxin subunit